MRRRRGRRGFLLGELAVAGVLLMAAMVLLLQLLGWTASQRRLAERRGRALQEAANAMERLAAMPWDKLSTESAQRAANVSADSAEVLKDSSVEVNVEEVEIGKAAMKRIRLSLRWRGASGVRDAPIRLSAWVARRGAPR